MIENLVTDLRDSFERAGQGHVFRFWEMLGEAERETLCKQAAQIDLPELELAIGQAIDSKDDASSLLEELDPAPWIPLPDNPDVSVRWQEAHQVGEQLLFEGKVAAFTVAGGQGTRLGCKGPKGTFPVTPVSQKSLFQVFAEKISASVNRYGKTIPWLIMTSEANHLQTELFFVSHDHFGLDPKAVHFLQQGMMPVVSKKGKVMLEKPGLIAMSPDGHGGAFRILAKSGSAKHLLASGIEALAYFQVDNPLAPFLEPAFLGFHALTDSEMSSRAAPKSSPGEKVGVFGLRKGALTVVEYSDLPEGLAQLRQSDGELVFRAGNLAMHLIHPAFAQKVGGGEQFCQLPFHAAHKKIPTIDENANPLIPKEPNGIKLETFVFDAIPLAKNSCVLEVSRAQAFSPVKNATGVDSIETCHNDQLRLFARWANEAGADLVTDHTGLPAVSFEISSDFALDEKEFALKWKETGCPPIVDGKIFA